MEAAASFMESKRGPSERAAGVPLSPPSRTLWTRGIWPRQIAWIGFDDERFYAMQASDFNSILEAYMEMFPDIPIKDVYFFFDEIQRIKGWELFVLRLSSSCRAATRHLPDGCERGEDSAVAPTPHKASWGLGGMVGWAECIRWRS